MACSMFYYTSYMSKTWHGSYGKDNVVGRCQLNWGYPYFEYRINTTCTWGFSIVQWLIWWTRNWVDPYGRKPLPIQIWIGRGIFPHRSPPIPRPPNQHQKVTIAPHLLAYGGPTDRLDEVFQMGESTIVETIQQFMRTIMALFGEHYIRPRND